MPPATVFGPAYFKKFYLNAATRVVTPGEMRVRARLIAAPTGRDAYDLIAAEDTRFSHAAFIAETPVDAPGDEARNVGVLRTLAAG